MTTNLPVQSSGLLPSAHEFQSFQVMAHNAALSGLYPKMTKEQAFMILLAARELGLPPMMSLNGGIHVIQGKVELSARMMNALIRRRGHSIITEKSDQDICVLKGKRADNGNTETVSFSYEEAQVAGLTGKDNWKKWRKSMLYARAMSILARQLFADVIGTAYVDGEIDQEREFIPSPVEDVVEVKTVENEEEVLKTFLGQFSEDEHEDIKEFLNSHAMHYQVSLAKAVKDYPDKDKFYKTFKARKERLQKQIAAKVESVAA